MKLPRFGFASLFSVCAIACSGLARAAQAAVESVLAFRDLVVSIAFPRQAAPIFAYAVAAAPRVIGLHEARSFRHRLAERWPASRQRTLVSAAYLAVG